MLLFGVNLVLVLGSMMMVTMTLSPSSSLTEAARSTARPYNQLYSAYLAHRNPLTPTTSDSSSAEKNSGEVVESPSQRCNKGGKTRIEDFTNVQKFYMCTFNSAHQVWMVYSFNCPSETQFDKHSQKCVSQSAVTTSPVSAYSKFAQQIKSQHIPPASSSSSSSNNVKTASYHKAAAAAAAFALTSTTPSSSTAHQVQTNPGQAALNQFQYMQTLLAQKTQALSKPGSSSSNSGGGGVNDNLRKTTVSPYNRIRPSPNPHQYVRFPQRPTIPTRPPYNYNYYKHFTRPTPPPPTTTTPTTTTTTTTEPPTTTTQNILQAIEKLSQSSSSPESGENEDGGENSPNNIGVIRMIASRIAYLAQAIESVLRSFDANSNFCDNDNIIVKLGSAEQLEQEEEEVVEDEEYDGEEKIHLHIQTPTSTTLSPPPPPSAAAAGPSVPVHFHFLDYYNRIKNGSMNHANLATTTTTTTITSTTPSNFVEKLHLTTPSSPVVVVDEDSDEETKNSETSQPQSSLVDSSSTENVVQAQTPETTTTSTTTSTTIKSQQQQQQQSLQDAAEWNIFLHNLSRLSATATTEKSSQIKQSKPDDSSSNTQVALTVADEDGDETTQQEENLSSSEEKVPTSPFKFTKFPSSSPTLANIQKIKELADSLKVRGNNRKPR